LANGGHQETRHYDLCHYRNLKAFGLDPKYDLESKHVIAEECWFLFGGSKKFKMKSFNLKLKDKVGMEEIY
jgi:hypothetical protein